MSSKDVVLELNNIDAGYGETEILHDISLYVMRQEIVSIIGPNGAGKSTVMKSILGMLNISRGSIKLENQNITGTESSSVVTMGVSYVPQTNNVFVSLTVQENLEMGAWTRKFGVTEKLDEMYELFPDLNLKRFHAAGTLSGGQRQMVAMAKALMLDAKILMLDEPTAGLSPKYRKEIFNTITKINSTGISVLMVEQNAKQALGISDRAYVLVDGKNRHSGSGKVLLNDREVARMFLGSKG